MTPDTANFLTALIGLPVIFGAGCMQGSYEVAALHADVAQPAAIRPYSARMGCRPWEPGLSRSVTIIATEDEHGALVGMQCIRAKERGKVRVM